MPIPLLLAAGAGLAAGGMSLASGLNNRTSISEVDKRRLAELERLQALGELGLTDEELASVRDVRLAPIQAAAREAQMRALGASQVQDIGGGAYYQQQLAANDQMDAQRQAAMRDVQAADAQRAAQQRADMQRLEKSIEDSQQQRKKDTWNAVLGALETGVGTAAGVSSSFSGMGEAAKANRDADLAAAAEASGLSISDYEQFKKLADFLADFEG